MRKLTAAARVKGHLDDSQDSMQEEDEFDRLKQEMNMKEHEEMDK